MAFPDRRASVARPDHAGDGGAALHQPRRRGGDRALAAGLCGDRRQARARARARRCGDRHGQPRGRADDGDLGSRPDRDLRRARGGVSPRAAARSTRAPGSPRPRRRWSRRCRRRRRRASSTRWTCACALRGGRGRWPRRSPPSSATRCEEAWTWEHMALTRARVLAGEPSLAADIEAVRCAVIEAKTDRAKIARMRARCARGWPRRGARRALDGQGRSRRDAGYRASGAGRCADRGRDGTLARAQLEAAAACGWIPQDMPSG
jgi:hypothetical protein